MACREKTGRCKTRIFPNSRPVSSGRRVPYEGERENPQAQKARLSDGDRHFQLGNRRSRCGRKESGREIQRKRLILPISQRFRGQPLRRGEPGQPARAEPLRRRVRRSGADAVLRMDGDRHAHDPRQPRAGALPGHAQGPQRPLARLGERAAAPGGMGGAHVPRIRDRHPFRSRP